MTKTQMLFEIAKCLNDPIYAVESYLTTEDRTQGGFVPFKLFPRQKELINGYKKHQHNIVMKPRQAGISTTTAAFLAILTALASAKSTQKILIAANKQETAKEFLKKIKDFTMQLPSWMDVHRPVGTDSWFNQEKNSSSHYKLWNGSEVKAVASSKDALRGYTPSVIVVDEAAFIEGNRGEEFYTAAQPSLSTGGKSILISCVTDDTFVLTPKGIKEVSDFIENNKEGGYYTKEYEIYGYGKSRKSNIFHNNGFVDTKIIETKYSILEGSNNHKLYAYSEKDNGFGWYKLEDLSIGDSVPIVYGHDIWGNNDDCSGVNTKQSINIITEDVSYKIGSYISTGLNFDDDFLTDIGFNITLDSKELVIPKRLFEVSRKNIISLIKGIINNNETFDETRSVISLKSKRLTEQIRVIFMNFGILTEYSVIINNNDSICYNLKIIKTDDANIFDLISNSEWYDDEHNKELSLKFLDIANEERGLIKDNITWVKVKNIKSNENNTYDFSLPHNDNDTWCHSVLYNGILGHQTPNGHDPLYYVAYKNAKSKRNNFNIVEMKWYEDPRYNKKMTWLLKDPMTDELLETKEEWDSEKWPELVKDGWFPTSPWFEDMCAQLNHNTRSIAQELLCDFQGSGDQVIDDKYIKYQESHNVREPIRKEWIDTNMWIWEDPIPGHKYIMAIDAASGSADDFGSVWILDFDTGNQVAEYHGKTSPDVLGEIGHYYAESYDAFVVVDVTGGYGISTVLKMLELGYPSKKMYYDTPMGIDMLENNKQLQKYQSNGKMPGLNFQKNRNTVIMEGEKAIRMDSIKIRSIRTLAELPTFVYINNRPDHQKGSHDDLLMGLFMANFVGMTSFKDLEQSKGHAKAMINGWAITTSTTEDVSDINEVTNLGFYTDANSRPTNKQSLEQTQEYMWMFGGLPGFKKNRR